MRHRGAFRFLGLVCVAVLSACSADARQRVSGPDDKVRIDRGFVAVEGRSYTTSVVSLVPNRYVTITVIDADARDIDAVRTERQRYLTVMRGELERVCAELPAPTAPDRRAEGLTEGEIVREQSGLVAWAFQRYCPG